LTVNSNAAVGPQGQLSFSGGGLTVTAGLTLHGAMLWSGGQIGSITALIVGTNGVITLTGSAPKILTGTITNGGTIVSSGSTGLLMKLRSLALVAWCVNIVHSL
jgi:hypothetical protein